jgi:aryl-alcohol dehydrogenase-like predicted oxidoreductase
MKKLSLICFGCEPLGGVDSGNVNFDEIEKAIYKALELGVNFFDTAGVYGLGLSEERLSKILGSRRHEVVIATKGGLSWKKSTSKRSVVIKDSSPTAIRRDVESSLSRLRLECLPIFFVHWPDNNTPIEDTFIELSKLKNEGKINSIGCSNFSAHQLRAACKASQVDYVQLPINILSGGLGSDISKICTNNKIKVIAYNILENGLLSGKLDKNTNFPENDRRSRLPIFQGVEFINVLNRVEKLKVKAVENNLNLLQYSINWVLMQKNISSVIIGIKNPEQIKENCSAIIN